MVSMEPKATNGKKYLTKATVDKIKGIQKQTDEISILMSVCSQEFMLQPNFTYE